MASEAQKAITDEQFDQIVLEVYEYVKSGKLSEMRVKGVARELVKKLDDDGKLMFTDARYPGEGRPIKEDTMYERVKSVVVNWRKYVAPLMETLLIEAAYQQARKAKENPAAFKTAASVIMPLERTDDNKPAISPGAVTILQRPGMGTAVCVGQGARVESVRDEGHECPDTVHPVADGQREDITVEVVSLGHDKSVYGVHEGADTPTRPIVPDTEMAPEDTVDDDGGADIRSA